MALNLHHFGLKSPLHRGNGYSTIDDMKMSPNEMDLISSSRHGGHHDDGNDGSSDEMEHMDYGNGRHSSSPSSISACSSSPDGGGSNEHHHRNLNNNSNNRKKSSLDYRTPMSRINSQPQQQQRQLFSQNYRGKQEQQEHDDENSTSIYEDSPLDFSTKRPKVISRKDHDDEPDSPCSKLRHRLIMKNAESMTLSPADALNLTKISPKSMMSGSQQPEWTSSPKGNGGANLSYQNISSGSMTSPTAYSSIYNIHSPMISPIITPNGIPGLPGVGMPPQMFVPLGVTATSAGSPGLPYPSPHNGKGSGSGRSTRPFKAYPKDPLAFPTMGLYGLSLGSGGGGTGGNGTPATNPDYEKFQDEMLKQVSATRNKRGGKKSGNFPVSDSTTSSTSPSNYNGLMDNSADLSNSGSEMCPTTSDGDGSGGRHKSGDQNKDDAYWERRRKNNEAAKRSRDARRKKEDQIAIRCAYLEQENFTLRFELHELRNQMNHLRQSITQ